MQKRCSTLKRKILFFLSRFVPGKVNKMFYKEYFKYCDAAPEMSSEIWRCLNSNYQLRKKYAGKYKIVSLGWDCLPRTLLTLWMLKPSKGAGEKSMPFDLIAAPPCTTAHLLANDFADYFTDGWSFDHQLNCWRNAEWSGVYYAHDPDCKDNPEDLEKLKKRMVERIKNFRAAVAFEKPVLFVMHKALLLKWRAELCTDEGIIAACKEIASLRKNKPYKILILSSDHNDSGKDIPGAEVIRIPYPYPEYVWHKEERFTPEGMSFEIQFLDRCRQALADMLEKSKDGK